MRRPSAVSAEAAIDDATPRKRGPGLFIAATVVLVVAIIGVGIYLVSGGKSKNNDATLPNAPGPTSIGDVLGGGQAAPPPPTVTSAVNGANAVFTWKKGSDAETYKVVVQGVATPTTTSNPTFTTPFGSATKVCVSVYAYQNNVVSQAAGQACASK